MAAPKGNQYAKGNKGPPPSYDDDFIENEASMLLDWIKQDNDDKIYIGSFAVERGYPRQKLSMFAESNKVFRDAYDKAKDWQLLKFIRNGLTKKWDPGFTQYVMARVCAPEWKKSWDKDDKDVKSSDLLEFLASLMAQAKAKDKPDADKRT